MKNFFYRIYQFALNIASYLVHWPIPTLLEGENSVLKIPAILTNKGITRVLLVTDKTITNLGLTAPLLQALTASGIETTVFDETVPNPTIDNIEKALDLYHSSQSTAIIAFGGGSSMDCAKGVGARASNPNKSIAQMRGLLKVAKPLPLLIAIPTTAGTGSETTIAAVISNPETHEKYAINDQKLIPAYAVLDPLLTVGLPPHITSTTGLDALTHAVEAYIGRSNTPETRKVAREAVKLIFDNLYTAYSNGKDVKARANMLKASFYAGIAFTRAYVGYVHAIAHTLGGYYSVPHGLANAVILPVVLDYYEHSTDKPLAELADLIGITQPDESLSVKAEKFIAKIKELEASMNIPVKIEGIIESDLPALIHNALREANPLYPVPKELFEEDFRKLYDSIRQV
ncbi:MAG: iron-containing alcohol dehydrogenase [Anaerolineaceae bacterium]|nr:iron-containing alcohol dehydrogenase [Anaerolineaceae bacterium]